MTTRRAETKPSAWSLVVVCIFAWLFAGCGKTTKVAAVPSQYEARVEVTPENGPKFERTFASNNPDDIAKIAELHIPEIETVAGRMIASYCFEIDGKRTPSFRIEVLLADGLMHGKCNNFGYYEGRWCLVGECVYDHGVQQGPFAMYRAPTGTKSGEGFLKNGTRDGGAVWYYPDGRTLARTPYSEGAFHGRCEVYAADGTIVASGTYDHGTMASGTFVEDLNPYLRDTLTGGPAELRIVTVTAADASSSPTP